MKTENTTTTQLPNGFKMTELGPLPEEWEVVRLGDVAEFMRGLSWRKSEETNSLNGKLIISIPNIGDNQINFDSKYNHYIIKKIPEKKRLHIGDVIFVGSSGSISNIGRNVKINWLPFDIVGFASFTFKASAFENIINQDFFYYLVNSSWCKYSEFTKRAADGKYNFQLKEFINNTFIPLPPLPEQKAIAAVLSAVQEAKEKTEEVIQATRQLKKSMMKHLFTYGPVPISETKNVKLKQTEIGQIPEHWEVVKLGEVASLIMGQSPPGSTYNEIGNGMPFLQGKAEFGNIYPHHLKYTTSPIKLAPNNSILMSVRAPVGDVNIANADYCIGRGLCSISLINGNNVFLFYLLNFLKKSIEKEGTGSTFKAINKANLENFALPLPPLPEQKRIAEILSAIDEKIEKEENKKKALEGLFKTLLSHLMTGKIRVNHLKVE